MNTCSKWMLPAVLLITLCSLVFSALGPYREHRRQKICEAQLHAWGQAFHLYSQDWDGEVPVKGVRSTMAQMGMPPARSLHQFAKAYQIEKFMVCPDARNMHAKLISSYWFPVTVRERNNPDISDILSRLGPAYPLMECDQHNRDVAFERQPSWTKKRVGILHADQSVSWKMLTAPSGTYDF